MVLPKSLTKCMRDLVYVCRCVEIMGRVQSAGRCELERREVRLPPTYSEPEPETFLSLSV